jgi:hypothetical protein
MNYQKEEPSCSSLQASTNFSVSLNVHVADNEFFIFFDKDNEFFLKLLNWTCRYLMLCSAKIKYDWSEQLCIFL